MQHSLNLKNLLLLITFPLYSQKLPPSFNNNIQIIIHKQSNYKKKINIYKTTIKKILQINQKLTKTYIKTLKNITSIQKNTTIITFYYKKKTNLFYISNNYKNTNTLFNKTYTTYKKTKQLSTSLLTYTKTNIIHNLSKQYQKTNQIYQKQLLQSQQTQQLKSKTYIYNQLNTLYHYQSLTNSTLFYYQLNTKLFSTIKNTTKILHPINNITILLKPINPNSNLIILQKIYQLHKQYNKPINLINTLISYNSLLQKQNLYINTFNHYKKTY